MVDALYDKEGTIQRIVRGMFTGIYSLTTSREPLNEQASDMAADLFVAKYGNECTLYAMMLYFGNYLTEYKACYCQYDVQDILRQFGKFLPRWRQRLAENEQPQQVKEAAQPAGVEGLKMMLRNRLYDGETAEQLKEGYLYTAGIVTDEMLTEAVQAVKDGIIY